MKEFKTIVVVNIGATLAEMNKKVLIIDADPQANTTNYLGLDENTLKVYVDNQMYILSEKGIEFLKEHYDYIKL